MVWLAFALMTAATTLALVWPLAGRRRPPNAADADTRFYADLMQEVEADLARGLVPPGEAATARAEIGRRLLAVARARPVAAGGRWRESFRARRLAAVVAAALLVPALALGLYLRLGHPAEPDMPLAARVDAPSTDLMAAIARIEAHLAAHPEDGRGFEVLAPVYLRMGRADDAVQATRGAIRALGASAAREAALGQALTMAADGVVTSEARDAFGRALGLDPKLAEARFFVALAAEQDGDKARAAAQWQALLADTPPDAPWRAAVLQHLGRPAETAPAVAAEGQGPAGPGAAAVAALPPEQRLQAIRGMVDGLAARLRKNGGDVEGWLRLIKAYTVLGQGEQARAALADARRALAADAASLARVNDEAHALGVDG